MDRIVEKLERIACALEGMDLPKTKNTLKESCKQEDEFLAVQAFSLPDGKTLVYGITKLMGKDFTYNSIITKKTPYEAEKSMLASLFETTQGLGLVSQQIIGHVSNPFLWHDLATVVLLSEDMRSIIENLVKEQVKLKTLNTLKINGK